MVPYQPRPEGGGERCMGAAVGLGTAEPPRGGRPCVRIGLVGHAPRSRAAAFRGARGHGGGGAWRARVANVARCRLVSPAAG